MSKDIRHAEERNYTGEEASVSTVSRARCFVRDVQPMLDSDRLNEAVVLIRALLVVFDTAAAWRDSSEVDDFLPHRCAGDLIDAVDRARQDTQPSFDNTSGPRESSHEG